MKEKKVGVAVTFRVDEEFYERFKAIAKALGYKPTEAVREAMRRFVKEQEKEVEKPSEKHAKIKKQEKEVVET
jgi:predicted transcriptional regulator